MELLPLAVDEDVNNHIIRGLVRRLPSVEILRAQDHGLRGAPDPKILEWATSRRIPLISHDRSTMTAAAIDRIKLGVEFSGLIVVPQRPVLGDVIDDLVLVAEYSERDDWLNRIEYLPLR